MLVGRRRRCCPLPPGLTEDRTSNVDDPDEASHDTVRDDPVPGAAGEHQAKATVDDAEGNEKTTQPEVGVGPESAAAVLLEQLVVQPAEDGHEEEEGKEKQADDGVIAFKLKMESVRNYVAGWELNLQGSHRDGPGRCRCQGRRRQ